MLAARWAAVRGGLRVATRQCGSSWLARPNVIMVGIRRDGREMRSPLGLRLNVGC